MRRNVETSVVVLTRPCTPSACAGARSPCRGGGAARAEQNAVITQLYNKTAEVKVGGSPGGAFRGFTQGPPWITSTSCPTLTLLQLSC